MSEQPAAKKRSKRSPAASAETSSERAPAEEFVPEVSETSRNESPVDLKSTPTYRLGLAAVIGLGTVIVIVLAIMVFGVTQGWGHKSAPAAPKAKPVSLTLAPGVRILSSDSQPGRLILRVRSDTVDEIWVINTDDGTIVARIHGEAPKQ
jgi:hypothetical protein